MNSVEMPGTNVSPIDAARFVRAFAECSREIQDMVLEMAEIIADESSTDDERDLAYSALQEALFPGDAADVLEQMEKLMKSPEAVQIRAELRAEEQAFADRLRALMSEKNVTQEQLAKAIDVGQPAISNLLARGCRPQRRTVVRLAEAFNVAPTDLWPNFSEIT